MERRARLLGLAATGKHGRERRGRPVPSGTYAATPATA